MLIFRRLRVARESQTGIRLREHDGIQQGQRSVLADPVAKYNYSTCVAKNVPDLSQKQSFSTLSALCVEMCLMQHLSEKALADIRAFHSNSMPGPSTPILSPTLQEHSIQLLNAVDQSCTLPGITDAVAITIGRNFADPDGLCAAEAHRPAAAQELERLPDQHAFGCNDLRQLSLRGLIAAVRLAFEIIKAPGQPKLRPQGLG